MNKWMLPYLLPGKDGGGRLPTQCKTIHTHHPQSSLCLSWWSRGSIMVLCLYCDHIQFVKLNTSLKLVNQINRLRSQMKSFIDIANFCVKQNKNSSNNHVLPVSSHMGNLWELLVQSSVHTWETYERCLYNLVFTYQKTYKRCLYNLVFTYRKTYESCLYNLVFTLGVPSILTKSIDHST